MMMVMGAPTIITLDGPAASGKSSVARSLACTLGIPFVSSGLFYRAATLLVLDCEVDLRCEGPDSDVASGARGGSHARAWGQPGSRWRL